MWHKYFSVEVTEMNYMQHQHAGSTNIDIGLLMLYQNNLCLVLYWMWVVVGGNVNYCNELGYKAYGIDGDKDILPEGSNFNLLITGVDCRSFKGPFDLCWSVEFAEHVEEKYILNFIRDFQKCRHLIFTAAPPRWGGVGHVNEQDENYWIKTLERHNFSLDVNNTNVIRKISLLEFDNRIRIPRNNLFEIEDFSLTT